MYFLVDGNLKSWLILILKQKLIWYLKKKIVFEFKDRNYFADYKKKILILNLTTEINLVIQKVDGFLF